jgi:hypothetical protein
MSQRPPSTYQIYVSGQGSGGTSDVAHFELGTGETNVPEAIGDLRLQGVLFLAAGNIVYRPSVAPSGWTPADITIPLPAPTWWEMIPGQISGTSTALPFVLCYGPLGIGGR